MTQSEMKDLAKQTRRCYQNYRRCHQEVQLYLLDFDSNPNLIQTMEHHADGYKNWDVHSDKTILDFNDKSKQ